jgi:hypothetical protein
MRPNFFLVAAFVFAMPFEFIACSGLPSSTPSLTLSNIPRTMHVGDTISTSPAYEKCEDATGRINTSSTTDYSLASNNPEILGVTGVKIFAVDTGTTGLSAVSGDCSGLTSAVYSITVIAK